MRQRTCNSMSRGRRGQLADKCRQGAGESGRRGEWEKGRVGEGESGRRKSEPRWLPSPSPHLPISPSPHLPGYKKTPGEPTSPGVKCHSQRAEVRP
uniref:Uncharacterized protein n=1 Tax=Schlesneria paludicola TaxID=360056 RepID=A0A7C2P6K3_9PLAN